MRKIGRNELCWCHSGKKYKKCHWERDKQSKRAPWEIASQMRANIQGQRQCMHALAGRSSCKGPIVKAHTIPRSAGLAAIAEGGHVYGPDYDFMSISKHRGELTTNLVGVNAASTFTGFCSFHDHTTFEQLENQPLTASPDQCFLMGYRAVCRELFMKHSHFQSVDIVREVDRGLSLEHQERIQWTADLMYIATLLGLADISYHKKLYDAVLTRCAWADYSSLVVEFGSTPDVLYTGAFSPEFDFVGRTLQRLSDDPPLSLITVTLLPSRNGSMAVLGWEKHSDTVSRAFAESLRALPQQDLGNAIVRLAFEHVENTFARPTWWESMLPNTRDALTRRMRIGADPDIARCSNCLQNDGLTYVDWPVVSVQMN